MKCRGVAMDMALIICAGLVLGGLALHAWSYGKGYAAATLAAELKEARGAEVSSAENARQQAEARATESSLNAGAAGMRAQLDEGKENARKNADLLATDLRGGAVRMSVRTTSCPPPAAAGGASQLAAAGPEEARANIHPADAADIARITAEADDTARELNYCIDRYEGAAAEIERYKQRLRGGAEHVEAQEPA